MKLKLTVSPQKLNVEEFVVILLPPQVIVAMREKIPAYAEFLSILLQLPVVLVGQGTGNFWQSFGESRFVQKVEAIGLVLIPWVAVEYDIPVA